MCPMATHCTHCGGTSASRWADPENDGRRVAKLPNASQEQPTATDWRQAKVSEQRAPAGERRQAMGRGDGVGVEWQTSAAMRDAGRGLSHASTAPATPPLCRRSNRSKYWRLILSGLFVASAAGGCRKTPEVRHNGASFPIGVVNDPYVPSVYVNDDGSFSLVHGVTPGLSTTFDSRIVRRLDFIHPGEHRVWRARVLSDVLRQYERGAVRLRVPVPDTAEVYCVLGWWKVTRNGDIYDVSRVVSDEKFVWAGPLVTR
jgi:hypothetical protein